jgi:hypothetical protein
MTPREFLIQTKQVLLDRGWCQHAFESPDGRCCIIGAVGVAAEAARPERETTMAAKSYLREALGDSAPNLFKFNDQQGRQLKQVLALFDRAIELASKEEAA